MLWGPALATSAASVTRDCHSKQRKLPDGLDSEQGRAGAAAGCSGAERARAALAQGFRTGSPLGLCVAWAEPVRADTEPAS